MHSEQTLNLLEQLMKFSVIWKHILTMWAFPVVPQWYHIPLVKQSKHLPKIKCRNRYKCQLRKENNLKYFKCMPIIEIENKIYYLDPATKTFPQLSSRSIITPCCVSDLSNGKLLLHFFILPQFFPAFVEEKCGGNYIVWENKIKMHWLSNIITASFVNHYTSYASTISKGCNKGEPLPYTLTVLCQSKAC